MPARNFSYNMTTNINDPYCDTGFGGYINLEEYGIYAKPDISGDSALWNSFSFQNPIEFYGIEYSGIGFSDDGFVVFDEINNYTGVPWNPQTIPDAMHRLFQSEEDDLIMEGKVCPKCTNQENSKQNEQESLNKKLGFRLLKSLGKRLKTRLQS